MKIIEKEKLDLRKKIGSGGEGIVYQISGGNVFKEYKNFESGDVEKLIKLSRLNLDYLAIPIELVIENNIPIGYTMKKITGVDLKKSIGMPKTIFQKKMPNYTRKDLLLIALDITTKIKKLHDKNVLIGDINENNFMLDIEKRKVYFIDCDSYQIDNFKCEVGTPSYTPPELQGIDFRTQFRTKENEYFSLAVLLFTILMPGQKPYASIGGTSVEANIKNSNFPYPLGLDYDYKEPLGNWNIIWRTFDSDLKKAFYSTFKEHKRIAPKEWIEILKNSLNNVNDNTIFPNKDVKIDMNITTRLAGRAGKGEMKKTILKNLRLSSTKIAVLELSTKAVKLLISDDETKKFDFDNFSPHKGGFRDAKKTETGNGLDKDNYMNMDYFKTRVLPVIKRYAEKAKNQFKVKYIYCVATAAIRSAKNKDDILKLIKKECDINCRILSKEEEASMSAKAFYNSGDYQPKGTEILKNQKEKLIAFIDQGGGSTEITIFNDLNKNEIYSKSLNLGTTALKNSLYLNSNMNTTLEEAFKLTDNEIDKQLNIAFQEIKKEIGISSLDACIGVGTAITKASNRKGNKRQHCYTMTIKKLEEVLNIRKQEIINEYKTVGALLESLKTNTISKKDHLDSYLTIVLGLKAYIDILERYNLNELTVSGTGLWYGVFYEALGNLKKLA